MYESIMQLSAINEELPGMYAVWGPEESCHAATIGSISWSIARAARSTFNFGSIPEMR